jgi:chloramphenicol 3-O phosphotransferase
MTTIVLNGASSAGKSSIAMALQERWNGPLLATGVDSFLAGWPDRYFAQDGEPPSTGFTVVTADGGGCFPQPGADGRRMYRAAHRAWLGVHDSGLDQVIDHVLLDGASKAHARRVLSGPGFLWVAVHCPVDELVRREAARGDRTPGFASGTAQVTHEGVQYDVQLDTSVLTPEQAAEQVLAAL